MNLKKQLSMKKQFFIKSFIRCFFTLIVPIILIGPYCIYTSNQVIEKMNKKNNWNTLYRIHETMESFFQDMDDTSLYFSKDTSVTVKIKNAFYSNSLSLESIKAMETISAYLQNTANTNTYIHSIYIYYNNSLKRFLTSTTGLTKVDNYYDGKWLASYNTSNKPLWYEKRELMPYTFSTPTAVITLYKSLYSTIVPNHADGVLVLQLHYNQLLEYISSFSLYNEQNITIADYEGNIILQNNAFDIQPVWRYIQTHALTQDEKMGFPFIYNGRKYIVSTLSSTRQYGWSYISIVPYDSLYAESYHIIGIIILLTIVAFVFSMLIAMYSSNTDYKRLENILQILDNAGKPDFHYNATTNRSTDTYGYIIENILKMFITQKFLRVQVSEKKYKLKVLEMQALQQQINPHFLYNTLHVIYWEAFSLTHSPNNCAQMVSSLSDIMKYTLSNPQEKFTIEQEINYLKHYLKIQKIRYNDKFEVIWEVDEEVPTYLTIKMLLQPLVENAIYHGIKEEGGTIKIKLYHRNDKIVVYIIDTGEGISPTQLSDIKHSMRLDDVAEKHIGLVNTHKRLVLTYGSKSGIKIKSKLNVGTIVSFEFPTQKNDAFK